jgi:predicted ATPase
LITFGAPVAHPDDADRAVAAALDMNRQLESLNRRLQEQFPDEDPSYFPFIKQRMGITQGDVFAGEVGWRQRREYTVMGDDVNLAARLMSKAEFGTIYISQSVWERVRAYYETEKLPPFPVKGKTLPINAYRVLSTRDSSIVRTSNTAFVGRDVTLLSLNMALQQAQRSTKKVRAIGLHGDIGVGKTRLMKQLAINAANSGFKVAWSTCRSQTTRKATWSTLVGQLLDLEKLPTRAEQRAHVHQALQDLGLQELQQEFDDLLFDITVGGKQNVSKAQVRANSKARNDIFDKLSSDRTLAMKNDELAKLRKNLKRNLSAANSGTLPFWNELEMRSSLTQAVQQFLRAFSANKPVLLAIDDLHKENQRALNVLKKIIHDTEDVHVMIIVAYEPQKDFQLNLRQVFVSDLTEEETYLMASVILNAPELGPRLSRFLWDSTSGRALYIESLVQTLRETHQLTEIDGAMELRPGANVDALPDNVRGLVISRIDLLSMTARHIVRAAAVIEDNFSPDSLRVVADIQEETQFQSAFDTLVELQIFEDLENGMYRFKHGVAQQAVYEELSRLQRQKLHLRVAEYLETLQDVEETILNRIYHLIQGGNQTKAMADLNEAAQRAEDAKDIDQALELCTRALELFPYNAELPKEIERLQQLRDA